MLNLLVAVMLAASTTAAPGQGSSQNVSPKCSAYQGRALEECMAKDTHPEENGPSTKGVEIDEAHRTAPENKADTGKNTSASGSNAAGSTSEGTENSSTKRRAPAPR